MTAQYLIRFDDICPTMNWEIWSRIEAVLLECKISPILAVIPENRDSKLMVSEARPHFWDEVRKWQARGWSIGLHGYQHLYASCSSGILGFPDKSEFAGVPLPAQETKLASALEIFRRESVRPEIWIAPAHSFDRSTLIALKRIGLDTISDGFALFPHTDAEGIFWVPQQLWRFRWRPFGLWTVCCHHNYWSQADLLRFTRALEQNRAAIASLNFVRERYKSRSPHFWDEVYSKAHTAALLLKRRVRFAA
jgi:predicted deacetylase